jgi:hypothetical protein
MNAEFERFKKVISRLCAQQRKRRIVRFKGICAVARRHAVTQSHLWRVLTGERHSPLLQKADVQKLKNGGAA